VTLTGTNDLGAITPITVQTDANGNYSFGSLRPGTYTITESQPAGLLDGKDTQGTPGGGTVINDAFQSIVVGTATTGTTNNFGDLPPPSFSSYVFDDRNNNGPLDGGPTRRSTDPVTLTGTDDLGATVSTTVQTDANGNYSFGNLRPGTYTIAETQPPGFLDGK